MDLPLVKDGVPYTNFKDRINQYILSMWQDDWIGAVANKLYSLEISSPLIKQEGRNCLVVYLHQSHTPDPFTHLAQRSSTSM